MNQNSQNGVAWTLIKLLLFTVLVPGSVVIYVPWYFLSRGIGLPGFEIGALKYLGALPMAAGAFFYLRSALDFALRGKGTPAPIDAPRFLVTSNLYRAVRNPMYVGVVMALGGEALYFESFAILRYAAAVWLAFHLFVLLYEEPTLRKNFGASYEEYCRQVPRWLPRFPRS